jgi:hypothetical protein
MDMHFYLFKFMYIRTYIICNCAGTWAEIHDVIGCSQKKTWSLPRSTASCTRRLFSACRMFQSTEAVPGRWHVPMPWCSWQNWKAGVQWQWLECSLRNGVERDLDVHRARLTTNSTHMGPCTRDWVCISGALSTSRCWGSGSFGVMLAQ